MPTFYYRAKTKAAQSVEGQILAENRDDAVEKIHQQGLVPVEVAEGKKGQRVRAIVIRRISIKEVYLFTRQLMSLLKAGVPILRSLETISSQVRDLYFRSVIVSIATGIRGGKSFSDCLLEYPRIFSSLYAQMIKAGEESGKLRESLAAMAEYLKDQNELMAKVKTAIVYPLLMLFFGVGTVIFILTYVMPQISKMFVDLHQTLPGPTIVVMGVSNFLVHYWWIVLLTAIIIIGLLQRWADSKAGQQVFSQMSLQLPFVGAFSLKVQMCRFCRTLELLLQSNVSLIRAMQLAIPVVRNVMIREQLDKCQEDILGGRSFGMSLKERRIIPVMIGDIVSVGEESGMLGDTFREIADTYEQEIEESIKVMTTLLEPLMILLVGSMVGFIVIAMLLPIFQLDVFAK